MAVDASVKKDITIKLDVSLADRARAYAERRGISFDQLVSQQLERAVSHDEYAAARRQVSQGRRASRNAAERILRARIQGDS
ncbi:MAG: hypothetical protein ACFHX7_23245 [Pseudomonadota bacterium]